MNIFFISTFLLAIYVTLDLVLNEQMWEANIKLTKYLQQNEFEGEQELMKFFSDWLNIFPAIALLVYMFRSNKLSALLYGGVIMFTVSLNAMLKNIYHQARPFWIENDIESLQCNKEFGKPSGHAMQSSVMCFLMPFMLFPTLFQDQYNSKKIKVLRFAILFIVTIWSLITGISRIYLGAHTFGQILLGWVFSTYIMINYMTYLHQKFLDHFQKCLAPEGQGISRKLLFYSFIAIIFWINISFLFYKLNRDYITISETDAMIWLQAIKYKCPNQTTFFKFKSASVFQNSCFNSSFQLLFIFFLLLGTKICGGTYEESKFYENFYKLKWYHKLYRIVILILLLMIIEPFVFFIVTEHLSKIIIFQTIPISFFGGIVLTYVYPKALDYLGLNIEGDFLYMIKQITEQNKKVVPENV